MANLLYKASIILTPTGYSNGSINNVRPSSAPFGDMELVKDSTSTRVNENGLVETVATDIPRIDYSRGDGAILAELQGTNQIRHSEDFSNALWTKDAITLTSSTDISPRGTAQTIYTIEKQPISGDGLYASFASFPTGQGTGVSVWIRKTSGSGDTGNVWIGYGNSSSGNGNTIAVGSSWQRIEYKSTGAGGGTIYIDPQNGYTFQVWGAQGEKDGSNGKDGKVTSYIPTTSGSVTRERDNYSGGGGSSLIGQTEGVFFFEGASLYDAEAGRGMSLSDSSPTNRIILYFDFASQKLRGTIRDGGGANVVLTGTVSDQTAFNKVAIKYKSGDIALWINGTEVETSTSTFAFTSDLNELAFDQGNPVNHMEGFIKQVIVYKEALSDAELTALTS